MEKVIGIIVMVLLIITGCSNKEVINHNYTYKGENELWIGEFKMNATEIFIEDDGRTEYNNSFEESLIVTYKNDLSEISAVKNIEISYKSSFGGGSLHTDFLGNPPDRKTYKLNSSGKGGAIGSKDDIIKVDISLDGKTQTIELKSEQ